MKQITVCIDNSKSAESVCDASAWASQYMQLPIVMLNVLEKPKTSASNLSGNIGLGGQEHLLKKLTELDEQRSKLVQENSRFTLEAASQRAILAGAKEVSVLQRNGSLIENLVELQSESAVIIIGRQGEDHDDKDAEIFSIGSQLETVIRSVSCPVLISTGSFVDPERFLVAFDGSETAQKALATYAAGPLLKGLECHLVMVNHNDSEHLAQLDQAAETLTSEGFDVTVVHLEGDIENELYRYQLENKIDLMVMGAYGHSRLRRFFVGSHTRNMVMQSEVPILLLR